MAILYKQGDFSGFKKGMNIFNFQMAQPMPALFELDLELDDVGPLTTY